jgi:hypothetical protein
MAARHDRLDFALWAAGLLLPKHLADGVRRYRMDQLPTEDLLRVIDHWGRREARGWIMPDYADAEVAAARSVLAARGIDAKDIRRRMKLLARAETRRRRRRPS